ncbi:hypothetical protein AAHE18_U019700 [Arachis hypogaea]
MKARTTTNVFAIFILFAFISIHLPSLATAELVDTDGNLIENGGSYYILPVFRGNGGGIGQTATGNETCPLTVVQQHSEVDNGLPIIISSPLKIRYLGEGIREGAAVKLTGFYENQVQGWFEIRKTLDVFKLSFCASSNNNCMDIGVKRDDEGNRLLVTTEDNPFVVVFKKARSSYSA